MMPILQIGPLALPLPELLILLGIWYGLMVAEKYAINFGIKADQNFSIVMVMLLTFVVTGRLAYVIGHFSAFRNNIEDIFSRNLGLFDPFAGLVFAGLAVLIYLQRKEIMLLSALDSLAPAFFILKIMISLSNLASGRAYGSPTHLPWAINLWGVTRHPTQIYETLLMLAAYLILHPSKVIAERNLPGAYFFKFLTLLTIIFIFSYAFRAESTLFGMGFRREQLILLVILALSLFGINKFSVSMVDNVNHSP
jgi:phosphatidylglycerol:prolipoprotein diacylglycerol transferase